MPASIARARLPGLRLSLRSMLIATGDLTSPLFAPRNR
ncbi:hypothetical protein Y590_14885 [Methylobacterium sp. AMS5]|nr:hypothetical protein Y590_14885 [Methylobacterium sp. AMS5]